MLRACRKICRNLVIIACVSASHLAFAESQSHTVQVSATILPRLELSIAPETGTSIAFGAIMQPAEGSTAVKAVAVNLSVFSNLDRAYHITHSVRFPLANAQGSQIPNNQFLVSAHGANRGQTLAATPSEIVPGALTTLYTSDSHGKSDSFVADYRLAVTPNTPAGDFTTEIVYTVTSL